MRRTGRVMESDKHRDFRREMAAAEFDLMARFHANGDDCKAVAAKICAEMWLSGVDDDS